MVRYQKETCAKGNDAKRMIDILAAPSLSPAKRQKEVQKDVEAKQKNNGHRHESNAQPAKNHVGKPVRITRVSMLIQH